MPLLDFQISDEDIHQLGLREKLVFDTTRLEILKSLESIDVQACPGSGKTTLIAFKLLLLAKKWPYKNRGICVLSHTNVAKNEIIERIEKSSLPEARRLLSYPNFIGTIQEFVNKHMGIPYLRSEGVEISLIDTNHCVELIYSKINYVTKTYFKKNNLEKDILYLLSLELENGNLNVSFPKFKKESTSESYKNIKETRFKLIKDGYLFYKDLYVFSEKLLISVPSVADYIQNRYPLVFIDEMQDIQKFQDDLLQKIFPSNSVACSIQRFGDPDQAIFNGINDELPNETYSGKDREQMSFIVDKSHRFDSSISNKIKNLSFNTIDIYSELSDSAIQNRRQFNSGGGEFQHSVLVFNDESIANVLSEFSTIVGDQFSQNKKNDPQFTVKVLGAVGNAIDSDKEVQLKIGHYWKGYSKEKDKKSFKGEGLIEVVYFIRDFTDGDWSERYKHLIDSILNLLRIAKLTDSHGKSFNKTSLKEKLVLQKKWHSFRKILVWLINSSDEITPDKWKRICQILGKIIGFDPESTDVKSYLAYQEKLNQGSETAAGSNSLNVNGIKIELSTIHGAKGETHDATLVLETRYYNYDIYAMLSFLAGVKPNAQNPNSDLKPTPSNVKNVEKMPNQQFMRQLYVAMSRPKHLLCFAIHESRITDEQKNLLGSLGWTIRSVPII